MDKQKEQRYSNVRFEHFWPLAHPVSDPKTSRCGAPERFCTGRRRVVRGSSEFFRQRAVLPASRRGRRSSVSSRRVRFLCSDGISLVAKRACAARRKFCPMARKMTLEAKFWTLEVKIEKSESNSKFDTLDANFPIADPKWLKTPQDAGWMIFVRFGSFLKIAGKLWIWWSVETARLLKKFWKLFIQKIFRAVKAHRERPEKVKRNSTAGWAYK
jgi:hypothetical protein